MKIYDLENNFGTRLFYDQKFRVILEDHMTVLRTSPNSFRISIEPVYAYKYTGDLIGILKHYNIPLYLHWIIMRMNNYSAYTDFNEKVTNLLIPDSELVERIRRTYMTHNKITT